MPFAHDTTAALIAAVDMVNTAVPPDTLSTLTELDAFLARHDYTGSRRHNQAELTEVRALRPMLRELLTGGRDQTVPLVNRLLKQAGALPQLVRHGHQDWHFHAVDGGAALATRITVETAMAMSDVIRAEETSRLAICADADCAGVVLDLSRNRSRKYCSTACGNRNAVASYRAREAARRP
jgi:predicted RNA-binding Zn ribbon-like protein